MNRGLLDLSPENLARLDHATLYMAREGASLEDQNIIAPYEHRAFAREATQENPLMALPISIATLLYQPYKALQGGSRSEPSWGQVKHGLIGVKEGLGGLLRGW